ncbi:hypothetical protein M408DRAFT_197963 [Serendipita vermifera MAFF 305830]|uniref:Zn(2)-C6 fungal-type domain-containing protein n=1 Tax=Serendipita vermifera MAFF 305830 TaxID=933852 RepID=A0A0C3B1A5_SERVB|nr:hypothetical protein M408DRAFT_197963 [Serendipita vermifera MAFF 305830]
MAHNNAFNISGNGRPLLSPIGSTHGMDIQAQLSGEYSPKHGHYSGLNGASSSTPDTKQGIKRKRSILDSAANRHPSEESYTDGDGPGGSSVHGKSQFSSQSKVSAAQQAADAKKRTKTQRACDKCRTKKIRCDVLPDTEPPLCAHCKQYNYDCTFFLPIQETRFKKKRAEEDPTLQISQSRAYPVNTSSDRHEPTTTIRTYGPTSIPFMINSTATLPLPQDMHSLNPRSVFTVINAGDGYVKVGSPASPIGHDSPLIPKHPDVRIEKEIIERLINSYFSNISPIFPVITKAEFLALQPSPPPILTYSICLMAAVLRDTPRGVFEFLRKTVASIIRSDDVLSVSSLANVQALLILSMSGDCHSTPNHHMMSLSWNRTGTAIRMAQDLNLHRSEVSKEGMETRRRVWATCVVVDRWYSAAFGYPQMIDLTDCDVRLPTPLDQGIGYLNALTRLSIILGEILKAIYSGLYSAQDTMLEDILRRLDLWKTHLPEELAFTGPNSGPAAGLLHVFYTCVCMIFWRVFMRISFICPPHIQFCLNVQDWNRVIENSRSAIQWFSQHSIYWDSWFVTSYALVSCALVQYHAWARRKDYDAMASLRLLRDTIKDWESTVSMSEHTGRAKVISYKARFISILTYI